MSLPLPNLPQSSMRLSCQSASADSCPAFMSSAGELEEVHQLQDKLEVSYLWAHDLETDLQDALEQCHASAHRCSALESILTERDLELQRASPDSSELCFVAITCVCEDRECSMRRCCFAMCLGGHGHWPARAVTRVVDTDDSTAPLSTSIMRVSKSTLCSRTAADVSNPR